MAKRYFSAYSLPSSLRKVRNAIEPFIFPLCCFQLIRTILWPTAIDIFILTALLCLYIAFLRRWI